MSSKRRQNMSEAEKARKSQAAREEIRVVGDPVLRERAPDVTNFDSKLRQLAFHMIEVMHDAPGMGLAATQLGVVQRVLVYEIEDDQPRILVNPHILLYSDEKEVHDEGCLSVPDVTVPVERSLGIEVEAADLHGNVTLFHADDMEARVIQHETDHLDGVLILDRTTRKERAAALREMRERMFA